MVNALLFSNNILIYEGIKTITLKEKDFQIVGWAQNHTELDSKYQKLNPKIIIIDYCCLNYNVSLFCAKYKKSDKCIILIVGNALGNQRSDSKWADGVLSANCSPQEFIESIRYFIKSLQVNKSATSKVDFNLTKREVEILQLLISELQPFQYHKTCI